jgi:hypothetical protein
MFHLYDVDSGVLGVIDFSNTAFLAALNQLRRNAGRVIEIERHGGAKDPKTTFNVSSPRDATEEERAAITGARLHNLPELAHRTKSDEDATDFDPSKLGGYKAV